MKFSKRIPRQYAGALVENLLIVVFFAAAGTVSLAAGIIVVFAAVQILAAEPAGMRKFRPEAVPAVFRIKAAGAVSVTADPARHGAAVLFTGNALAAAIGIFLGIGLAQVGKRTAAVAIIPVCGRTAGSAGRVAEAVLHILAQHRNCIRASSAIVFHTTAVGIVVAIGGVHKFEVAAAAG